FTGPLNVTRMSVARGAEMTCACGETLVTDNWALANWTKAPESRKIVRINRRICRRVGPKSVWKLQNRQTVAVHFGFVRRRSSWCIWGAPKALVGPETCIDALLRRS